MPSSAETTLFLLLFCGLPLVFVPIAIVRGVRALLRPNPITVLERAAEERGWRNTRQPRRHVFRVEGEIDGAAFVLERRRRRGRPGRRRAPPVEVSLPAEAAPGLFVVQSTPSGLVAGPGDALVREGFAELVSIALDERAGALLGALRRVPAPSDAGVGAWSTEPDHPLVPRAEALVALVAGHPDRARLVLDVLDGRLTLRLRDPSVPLADLVPFAAECRRALRAS